MLLEQLDAERNDHPLTCVRVRHHGIRTIDSTEYKRPVQEVPDWFCCALILAHALHSKEGCSVTVFKDIYRLLISYFILEF